LLDVTDHSDDDFDSDPIDVGRVDRNEAESVPVESVPFEPIPFVLGGRPRRSLKGALSLLALFAFTMLPVRGLYRSTGSSLEEGFMLVFPRLVQQGKVPNVDFLHLYGPGSLEVLAGWYWVFGYTLEAQRTFGLLQHLLIIFGLYTLTRAWGRIAAVGAGIVAALLIMTPIGLSALAWHGAVGMALWAVVFAVRARTTAARSDWLIAGLIGGFALSFRPDMAIAISVALAGAAWAQRRQAAAPLIGAGIVGLIPMWIHLIVAGPGPVIEGLIIDPVFNLRAGRELPTPPSFDRIDGALQAIAEVTPPWWNLPAPAANHQLFFWFFAVFAIAIAVPVAAWRNVGNRNAQQRGVLIAAGLLGLGMLPQALQRPDSTHLAWVAVVSWPLLIVVIVDLIRARPPRPQAQPHVAPLAAVASLLALLLVVAPFYTYRMYLMHTRVSAGDLPLPFLVEREGRRFWFGNPIFTNALNDMIPELDAISDHGDRLIVGTADLSRTVYNDVSIYFLFPELEPGTYFIEMDPGLADAEGSGLAEDIAEADFLVLTNVWSGWAEPNESVTRQSQEHNQAVADNFCLRSQFEDNLVLLFERCEGGGGISGADVLGAYPTIPVPEPEPEPAPTD
jgi:hypothetical protein